MDLTLRASSLRHDDPDGFLAFQRRRAEAVPVGRPPRSGWVRVTTTSGVTMTSSTTQDR